MPILAAVPVEEQGRATDIHSCIGEKKNKKGQPKASAPASEYS